MYKKTMSIVCAMSIMIGSIVSAQATDTSNVIQNSAIPDSATPGAVLEYVSNGMWQSISSAQDMFDRFEKATDSIEANDTVEKNSTDVSMIDDLSVMSFEDEEELITEIDQESEGLPVYREELPDPAVGMCVVYDNWGEVEEIYMQNKDGTYSVAERTLIPISNTARATGEKISVKAYTALPQGSRLAAGTYNYGSVVSETKTNVGYTTNTIKITNSHVLGTGDFTVFTDTTGDHDNSLKYGDCATKGNYDNPRYGTSIATRNVVNNVASSFIKNDNGALPNAVLDIWKTGVSKLGITSTNYNNIKFAGRYYYEF